MRSFRLSPGITIVLNSAVCHIIIIIFIITRAATVVLFYAYDFVCVFVYLFVNKIAPGPLEISSRNFQGIILWSKGRTSSKMAVILGVAGGDLTSLMFLFIYQIRDSSQVEEDIYVI